jgi:F-type H+-transporting ATPase subunit delta
MAVIEERYAVALLEISIAENSVKEYLNEVECLKQALEESKELIALYLNPQITLEEKLEVTEKCFADRFSEDLTGLIEVVVKNGRSAALPGILDSFIDSAKDYLKIGIVYVTSAQELSTDQKSSLEKKLLATTEYTTLEMHYKIDKELIGGMVIRIKDRILDNSIKTKLDTMARELRQVQL